METITQIIARELARPPQLVENVITMIDEGNTIPFIARYRKENHGSMDDQVLRTLADRLTYLRNLEARRVEVKNTIDGQEKLTDALSAAIDAASTLAEVEDLYRPYKQKRRTRATIARERGLAPLAEFLLAQEKQCDDPLTVAAHYIDEEKGVSTPEDALAGARDILAEGISDDAALRRGLRVLYQKRSVLTSKATKEEDSVYRLYYDFSMPVEKLQGHQILAINRGEREEFLKASIAIDAQWPLELICRTVLKPGSPTTTQVELAAQDGYSRLIAPSMEREMRTALTDQASEGAIAMFALNLKPLLMQPPVKGNVTMGLDPGYRNGCKVAVVDGTGKVLDTAVVYPTFSAAKQEEAISVLSKLMKTHKVENIAIGNGTASKETEMMTATLISRVGGPVTYMVVNEAGASVYSASKLASDEFPQYDVNLRSAISIARRLQDPLAELVKIDPKAIGVGQYQHDMPQARLDETLSGVVEDCVNAVGVDLNTASAPLLTRVSGLNGTTAKNIVKYREENGIFTTRRQLLKVPKLGPKAYEQCTGFLRVPESKNVLDNTGVHPESYTAANTLLTLCGYSVDEVKSGEIGQLKERISQLGEADVAARCAIGLPTLRDLTAELLKPGRDPRDELPPPLLRSDIMDEKDLKPGMELRGTVRNVIDFGVFVDIGVHQDGLVHISQLCDKFVRHPSQVCAVGDVVTVWVIEVDEKKKRISLTMKKPKS